MNLLRRLLVNRAAKGYARKLLPWLQRSFGASEHYTPAQIRGGVAKLRLSAHYIAVAYAAFLPESEFERLGAETPVPIGYRDAWEAFERYRPARLTSDSASNEVGLHLRQRGVHPDHWR